MSLNANERKALFAIAAPLPHGEFQVFLTLHLQLNIGTFSSPEKTMRQIAVDFIAWLDNNPPLLIPALEGLLEEFGQHARAAELVLARERLRASDELQMPATPWEVPLVEGVPVVNRTRLRGLLREIVANGLPKVVQVDGPSGTGRSHSYRLIQHVAAHSSIDLVRIDVDRLLPEDRNLPSIATLLANKLGLAGFTHPDTVGATAETIAVRYAENFALALNASPTRRTVWFVFDSLDRHRLTEVRGFIMTLIDMGLRMDLARCVFFLLGAGPEYEIDDPFRLVETESIGVFSAHEIEEFAKRLNRLGKTPLSEPVLGARMLAIKALLGTTPVDQVCGAVCSKLADLRAEVRP